MSRKPFLAEPTEEEKEAMRARRSERDNGDGGGRRDGGRDRDRGHR